MADDPISAELAPVRERWATAAELPLAEFAGTYAPGTPSVAGWMAASLLDVPRLLAAVDAALKLAAGWETDAAELDRDVAVSRRSPYAGDHHLADTDAEIAKKLREHAGDLRAAIADALTREGER